MVSRFHLRQYTLLHASGPERDAFLQGQLSNDIKALTGAQAQLSSYNSAKGRVLAVLQLARLGESVLMLLPTGLAQSVLQRLRMYILRTQVVVDSADGLALFGLAGEGAAERVSGLTGAPAPGAPWQSSRGHGLVAWRVPGGVERCIVAGAADAVRVAWDACEDAGTGDEAMWRLEDIRAGLPELAPATQDAFVAQMLALDTLGAISFDKGCYTGQEIIARAHYRGKVKRHAALGCSDTREPFDPGTVLVDAEGRPAATVVRSERAPEGGVAVLAVLHREYPADSAFTTAAGQGVLF